MFVLLLLFSALSLSSGTPTQVVDDNERVPILVFGRQLPAGVDIAKYRTRQEIALSCLATIFVCTWVAIHPNAPGPWDSGWMKLKRRVLTMVVAMLAPEFITMWAFRQWIAARRIAKELNEADGHSEVVEESCWEMIKSAMDEWFHGPYQNPPRTWTITHGFFVQMGGFYRYEGWKPKAVFRSHDLKEYLQEGHTMPYITEEEINDKSKGDFLTKLFVVLQTTWFVFQCIARWISHLAVTELEVVTLAFAVLNVMTYALWWKKPQNVVVSVPIGKSFVEEVPVAGQTRKRGGGEQQSYIVEKLRSEDVRSRWAPISIPSYFIVGFLRPLKKMGTGGGSGSYGRTDEAGIPLRVRMFGAGHQIDAEDIQGRLPLMAVSVLFGALHLISWSSPFPSTLELWLWRSSAIFITTQPLTHILWEIISEKTAGFKLVYSIPIGIIVGISQRLALPLYVLARLILLCLALTTLRQLPESAYSSIDWTTFIPHL